MTAQWAALTSLCVFLLLNQSAAAKTPPIYTVSKINVSAEANNAVEAKEKALSEAQKIALRELFKRMTGRNVHARLPVLEGEMVERMVEGFAVRRESNSNTRYIATLDFTFEPNSVRDILNRFGLPYADQQAPQSLLIPVMIEGGAERAGSDNPWFEAFASLDTEHALAPVKIAPARANMVAALGGDLSASSRSLFETLSYQYRADNLILAIADVNPPATELRFRLIGQDAVGRFALERKFKIFDRDIDYTARIAAAIGLKVIEGRWKVTRLASQGALEGPADLETVAMTAQFAGLKAWQGMRQRLLQVPGLQALDIKGINARGASLTVDFPGGAERLALAARSQGLSLEQQGSQWVLSAQ